MKKTIFILLLSFLMTGCVTSMVQDAIDAADERMRLKWSEEWKPALQSELKLTLKDVKDELLNQVMVQIEGQEEKVSAKLDAVNIKLENFDINQDGSVTGVETLALLKELKNAKDKEGNPLGWSEILAAVVLGYGGTTAGKEWLRSRMIKNGGNGKLA